MKTEKVQDAGTDLGGTLLTIFLVLKLTGLIDWSWWWVLSPLWIGTALCLVILFIGFAVIAYQERVR